MTRWPKNSTEFNVSLTKRPNHDGSQSWMCYIPKPVVDLLDDPNGLKFTIKDKKTITVKGI